MSEVTLYPHESHLFPLEIRSAAMKSLVKSKKEESICPRSSNFKRRHLGPCCRPTSRVLKGS